MSIWRWFFLGQNVPKDLRLCESLLHVCFMVWYFDKRVASSHVSPAGQIYNMSVKQRAKIVYITENKFIMKFSVTWRLIWYIPLKCWLAFIELQGIPSYKIIFFVVIAVRTFNWILHNITLRLPNKKSVFMWALFWR